MNTQHRYIDIYTAVCRRVQSIKSNDPVVDKLGGIITRQNYASSSDRLISQLIIQMRITKLLDSLLKEAYESCMPKRIYKGGKKPDFWWIQKIVKLRAECLITKRRYKRSRLLPVPAQSAEECAEFKEARKKLKKVIRKSKEARWSELFTQVEKDPWRFRYRLVTEKLLGRRAIPGLKIPGRL